jgi:hypothetical protein
MTAGLATLGLFLFAPVAVADDDWDDHLHDHYKHHKKQLERYYEHREDALDQWYDAAEDRLEDARRHALHHAPKREHDAIRRYFREQEKALERAHEHREEALDRWEDQERDLMKDRYKSSRKALKYGGLYYPHLHGPSQPVPHAPPFAPPHAIPHENYGPIVPDPQSGRPRWGFRIGPLSFGTY